MPLPWSSTVGARDEAPWRWILHESPPIVFTSPLGVTVWITKRLNSPACLIFQSEIKLLPGSVIWLIPWPGMFGGSSHSVELKHVPRTSLHSSRALCIRHQSCLKTSNADFFVMFCSLLFSLSWAWPFVRISCFDPFRFRTIKLRVALRTQLLAMRPDFLGILDVFKSISGRCIN